MRGVVDIAIAQRDLAALQLVGETGVVRQVTLRQDHLVSAIGQRLAVVAAFQQGDFISGVAQFACHGQHQIAALVRADVPQDAAVKTGAGGADGKVNVASGAARHLGNRFGGGRVGDGDPAAVAAIVPGAADVILPIGSDAVRHVPSPPAAGPEQCPTDYLSLIRRARMPNPDQPMRQTHMRRAG